MVPATQDITQQVRLQFRSWSSNRFAEDTDPHDTIQCIVYKRSEPEKDGSVWEEIVQVYEYPFSKKEALKARMRRDFRGRIVDKLNLEAVQRTLF